MSGPIQVLVVDDHEIVREGLTAVLADASGIAVVGEAATGAEAVRLAGDTRPDVVLLDLVLPDMDGVKVTRLIRTFSDAIQVLVLTAFADDGHVRGAIQAGAVGYLLKDVGRAELVRALHAAAAGRPTLHPKIQRSLMRQAVEPGAPPAMLSAREQDVLRWLARGRSNREIAAVLGLTEGTVRGHVSAVVAKLGVADRTQAALLAVRQGLAAR